MYEINLIESHKDQTLCIDLVPGKCRCEIFFQSSANRSSLLAQRSWRSLWKKTWSTNCWPSPWWRWRSATVTSSWHNTCYMCTQSFSRRWKVPTMSWHDCNRCRRWWLWSDQDWAGAEGDDYEVITGATPYPVVTNIAFKQDSQELFSLKIFLR